MIRFTHGPLCRGHLGGQPLAKHTLHEQRSTAKAHSCSSATSATIARHVARPWRASIQGAPCPAQNNQTIHLKKNNVRMFWRFNPGGPAPRCLLYRSRHFSSSLLENQLGCQFQVGSKRIRLCRHAVFVHVIQIFISITVKSHPAAFGWLFKHTGVLGDELLGLLARTAV